MTNSALGFTHRFVPGTAAGTPPLLLLHGTGGDETDLLSLGRSLVPGAALLAPRGPVLENGMPRFFRRLAEGVFDEADVRRRAADLADFVARARAAYGLAAPVAVGFSNGANIAAALLLLHPDVLAGAVLLRPMLPLTASAPVDLAGRPVLMLSGAADPIVPAANAAALAQRLRDGGARVSHETLPTGHGLSQADVARASAWLAA
ncbi:alpha/beta hydrolase [Methylobacterium goesingense]|uniref:Phospholipase/carboxylesterase n=1 Tax=Methylobacterium goesingense TaxID=243690 RepID=A0ABV2L3L9_9HYPH|nr:alpha/beta hydrolase [Methylobacterium goesingense]GJD73208.1 Putative hydrolase MhqD [Methylobacterium goesingense]